MINFILVPLSDSVASRTVVNYVANISFCPEDVHLTLLHIYKEPTGAEDLMGKKFVSEQKTRIKGLLNDAKDKLVESGFNPRNIQIKVVEGPYPTVTDGIIDQFNKGNFDMVILGRKHMTKAEEFVLGDISIKLIRSLEKAAILVVK